MAEDQLDNEEKSSEADIDVKNDIYNYKGYFVENEEEEEEQKYYEFGAHFPYKYLYQKLEILAHEQHERENQEKREREKEKKDKKNGR